MTTPPAYYQGHGVTLHHGDSLDVLRAIPDASIDSVVTDPPYNLSNSGKRDTKCLRQILAEIRLPHNDEVHTERGKGGNLTIPPLSGSALGRENRPSRVETRIRVPEGAIDLQSPPITEQEIKTSDEPAATPTDGHLSPVDDTETVETLRHFILQLANGWDEPFCDATCSCFTEPGAGLIAVTVIVPLPSSLNGSGDSFPIHRGDADIRRTDNTRGEPERAPGILASGRTERHHPGDLSRMSVVSMVNAHRAEVVAVPLRIQRQRAKGWRMPKGAVYVGRPGKFGNPFAPRIIPGWATDSRRYAVEDFTRWISHPDMFWRNTSGGFGSAGESVERARALVEGLPSLRGKDLACWCPVGQPCHGDVLLELANA